MTESKRSRAETPEFNWEGSKTVFDPDVAKAIWEKAFIQQITLEARKTIAKLPLEDLVDCEMQLKARKDGVERIRNPHVQRLLDAVSYARTLEPKEKKTGKLHFVTINPKDDTCVVCFQDDLIDLVHKQQAKNKLMNHEWVLEFTKSGKVHSHSIMEFEQDYAVSQVRDRIFKKLASYLGSKAHVVVKRINNIKGIREYMDNAKKGEKEDKKEASTVTQELREHYGIADSYKMEFQGRADYISLECPHDDHCILNEKEDS